MASILTTRRRALQQTLGSEPSQVRETFPHPNAARGIGADRHKFYEQMYSYYSNTVFDDLSKWVSYKKRYALYRYTRSIFNPFQRLVDFYSDHIYPGVLSAEPDLPTGVQSAIPLSHDTPPEIRAAIAQLWQWSNWAVRKGTMTTFGGMTGNCLVEVVDDPIGGNVRFRVMWPGLVKDFRLDEFNNLDEYLLEYQAVDPDGQPYTFNKLVTRTSITTYRDGRELTAQGNPYPFIPAVWVKHLDLGSDFGVNAMRGGQAKFDELNSAVSHVFDHIHKLIRSPRILWAKGQVKNLFRNQDVRDADFDERNEMLLLKGEHDGKTDTLVGNLDPATIVPVIKELISEIEADYPEIVVYRHLRDQNIVTGPGAKLQMGDVESALQRVSESYDSASIRLFQMALAIGGERANSGDWGVNLSTQQQKFLPFSFSSYTAGQLDAKILPRPLFSETSSEVASELQQRAQAVASVQAILPLKESYKMLNFRDDEIEEMISRKKTEREEELDFEIKKTKATQPPQPAAAGGSKQ